MPHADAYGLIHLDTRRLTLADAEVITGLAVTA